MLQNAIFYDRLHTPQSFEERQKESTYRRSEQPSKASTRLYDEKLKSTKGVARNVPELREGTTTMRVMNRAVPDFF